MGEQGAMALFKDVKMLAMNSLYSATKDMRSPTEDLRELSEVAGKIIRALLEGV